MKAIYLGIMLVTLLFGCALFKQSTKISEEQEQRTDRQVKLKSLKEMENSSNAKQLTFRQDSVQSAYSFWLWPNGNIKFSAERGFEGSFDSILVKGDLNHITKQAERTEHTARNKLSLKADFIAKSQDKLLEKKSTDRSFPTFIWIIGIPLLLILAVFSFRNSFFMRDNEN